MSQESVDDNSSANDRTSSETQISERTTKTSLSTNEGESNDAASSVSLIYYVHIVSY